MLYASCYWMDAVYPRIRRMPLAGAWRRPIRTMLRHNCSWRLCTRWAAGSNQTLWEHAFAKWAELTGRVAAGISVVAAAWLGWAVDLLVYLTDPQCSPGAPDGQQEEAVFH